MTNYLWGCPECIDCDDPPGGDGCNVDRPPQKCGDCSAGGPSGHGCENDDDEVEANCGSTISVTASFPTVQVPSFCCMGGVQSCCSGTTFKGQSGSLALPFQGNCVWGGISPAYAWKEYGVEGPSGSEVPCRNPDSCAGSNDPEATITAVAADVGGIDNQAYCQNDKYPCYPLVAPYTCGGCPYGDTYTSTFELHTFMTGWRWTALVQTSSTPATALQDAGYWNGTYPVSMWYAIIELQIEFYGAAWTGCENCHFGESDPYEIPGFHDLPGWPGWPVPFTQFGEGVNDWRGIQRFEYAWVQANQGCACPDTAGAASDILYLGAGTCFDPECCSPGIPTHCNIGCGPGSCHSTGRDDLAPEIAVG